MQFMLKKNLLHAIMRKALPTAITWDLSAIHGKRGTGMKFEKIDCGKGIIAVVSSDSKVITDVDSALDFVLSSGLAGEILQKYINYGGKIAIYGGFSHYTSKPLKDFIFESNKGKDVFFVATKEEAVQKLTEII